MNTAGPGSRAGRWWPVLVVAVGVLVGLLVAVVSTDRWRAGAVIIGCSLLLGAGIRLALPAREAGLLQVRGRGFDVVTLVVGGVAIVALALAIPGR